MLVLGLDTALQSCSIALMRDGACLAERAASMERGHAEHIALMARDVFAEAGIEAGALDRVGVVVGPGGFTGVRVGLAFARGLVIGGTAKAAAVTSLAALAANVTLDEDARRGSEQLIAPLIDARRGQVYAALYDAGGGAAAAPFVAEPHEALQQLTQAAGDRAVLMLGTGAKLINGAPMNWREANAPGQIDAKVVARLAAAAPAPDGPPAPLYLRAPDAKPAKPSRFAAFAGRAGQ